MVRSLYALLTDELTTFSFKFYDAFHLACAESGKADVFLTTDERLRRKALNYQKNLKIKVVNPVLWLMEVTNKRDNNDDSN